MTDSDTKRRIIARRRRFVAAAIAGAGVAGCASGHSEQPTSPAPVVVSVEKPPQPDAADDPKEPPEREPGAEPTVCLSVAPEDEAPPEICLSYAP